MPWLKLFGFLFDTGLGKAAAAAAGFGVFLVWFSVHNASQRSIGAERAVARQESENAKVRVKADNAARRSVDPAARGVLNPNYRAD
jgi:hypothetical protein